jgi:hypothetical protein
VCKVGEGRRSRSIAFSVVQDSAGGVTSENVDGGDMAKVDGDGKRDPATVILTRRVFRRNRDEMRQQWPEPVKERKRFCHVCHGV